MLAIDCLKQASLKEILSNDSLPDKVQARIFELEAGALAAYLSTSVAPKSCTNSRNSSLPALNLKKLL